MNPGNTGQRYKMATLTSVRAEGKTVIKVLSCGHEVHAKWETPEAAQRAIGYVRIGKRQRCTDCEVQL